MRTPRTFSLAISLIAIFSAHATLADRGQNWEASLQVLGNGSESSSGENGSGLDVDSSTGWGFGVNYNFNEHLGLGFDGSFLRPRYDATFNTDQSGLVSVRHKMSVFNGQVNGTWNILKGPFTPYLQAGLGWTHVDSNVTDGPPVTGCWWDPWWGYVCQNFFSTYNDTRFSYGLGAGLRYDFTNGMFLKGSVNRVEIDSGGDGAEPTFDMWKLELGWRFNN